VYFEDLCFQAQQAAEKALKALLLHRGITFPYVHDLGQLVSLLLDRNNEESHNGAHEAARLNGYVAEASYPDPSEPVDSKEYRGGL
jgi:HEPN domain-containing protein